MPNDRSEDFDRFLAQSLAPPERMPDSKFVGRVRQQILLEKLRRRSLAKTFERLGVELLSILAVGCALLAVGAGSGIADSEGDIPAGALAGIAILFAGWVAVVSRPTNRKVKKSTVTYT